MRALLPFVLTCTIAAACSSVPDVTYDDDDEAGAAVPDAGLDADAGPARHDASSGDAGACSALRGGDVCCGTSVCEDKDCGGATKQLRCDQCAGECPDQRCCPSGVQVRCVAAVAKCN